MITSFFLIISYTDNQVTPSSLTQNSRLLAELEKEMQGKRMETVYSEVDFLTVFDRRRMINSSDNAPDQE